MNHQSLVDQLSLPKRLSLFQILTPEYDPNFKPLQGFLRASYNGLVLAIKVDKTEVSCHVCGIDICCFELQSEFLEPASVSWAEICQVMLTKVIITHHEATVEHKLHLIAAGKYREH